MRELHIIGGSNSLMKNGWVANLRKSYGDSLRITNVSIGATTSLIGIYRMLRGDIPDGSTVVWEYALNESNHFNAGQSLTSLMYHLDWFVEVAHRKNIRVLPLQFWTRPEHITGQRNEYREELQKRLISYGLNQIDAWQHLCDLAEDLSVDTQQLFSDNMHYSGDTTFFPSIAEQVFRNLDNAVVPKPVARLEEKYLSLCPPSGEGEIFKTSAITARAFSFSSDIHIEAQGKLLASFVIAANDAGAATVTTDDDFLATYSVQAPISKKPPGQLLKHWIHWSTHQDQRSIKREIVVSGCRPTERPVVQNMFAWRGSDTSESRMDAYLCSLIEA